MGQNSNVRILPNLVEVKGNNKLAFLLSFLKDKTFPSYQACCFLFSSHWESSIVVWMNVATEDNIYHSSAIFILCVFTYLIQYLNGLILSITKQIKIIIDLECLSYL